MPSSPGQRVSGARGAAGIGGGEAIADQLDRIILDRSKQKTWHSKVVRLTESNAGQDAMIAAGIDLHNRKQRAKVLSWLSSDSEASTKSQGQINAAYLAWRRKNVAPKLIKELEAAGGTQIEVHPVNQSGVLSAHQRELEVKRFTVRRWSSLVHSWADQDISDMDSEWEDIIADISSDWAAYVLVSAITFWV